MTAKDLIEKYRIKLGTEGRVNVFEPKKMERDNMLSEIREKKPEIIAILTAEKEAEKRAYAERRAKIDAIEGLHELEKAYYEHEGYHRKMQEAMDDEFNDGVNFPRKPQANINDLKVKYPRASAYLYAQSWERSENHAKYSAGHKALERIIDGEPYDDVIAEMEKEWSDYCDANMWD